MQHRIADLHCDTFKVLSDTGADLASNDLSISLDKAAAFHPYIQTAAVWSDSRCSDEECWRRFLRVADDMEAQLAKYAGRASLCRSAADLDRNSADGIASFIYAVEDARILCGNLARLDVLYERGVRFLTLTWSGETIVGGSFDTDTGLTDFGKAAVRRALELGIVPDISHASRKTAADALAIAEEMERPIVATHSNSQSVMPLPRNLTDEEFLRVARLGGIVGISFAAAHLTAAETCTADTVIAHIRHYFDLGGEDHVALGCDFDGIDRAPEGLEDISKLGYLADTMQKAGFTGQQIDKVFYANASAFMRRNLK